MNTKDEYRSYFLKWKKYVRYAPILDELDIQRTNFSQFLRGSNVNALSVQKLEMVKNRMKELFITIDQGGNEDDNK
ncbi:MAG: hypothetical protein IKG46_12285 [Solobacterium sp.]|nr:hypothetical protein [Solobacterium sp.]